MKDVAQLNQVDIIKVIKTIDIMMVRDKPQKINSQTIDSMHKQLEVILDYVK